MLFEPSGSIETAADRRWPALPWNFDIVLQFSNSRLSLRNDAHVGAISLRDNGATLMSWSVPTARVEALVADVPVSQDEIDVYPCMAGIQRVGIVVRAQATRTIDAVTALARVELTSPWACNPETGQTLEMLHIARPGRAIGIGTESYTALAYRAQSSEWLPGEWASQLQRWDFDGPLVEARDCFLRIPLPGLQPGQRFGVQYVIAYQDEATEDNDDGPFFATDLGRSWLLEAAGVR